MRVGLVSGEVAFFVKSFHLTPKGEAVQHTGHHVGHHVKPRVTSDVMFVSSDSGSSENPSPALLERGKTPERTAAGARGAHPDYRYLFPKDSHVAAKEPSRRDLG